MQSINRAMTVAKVLAANTNEKGVTISNLAKQCELPLSTMHRLLQAMMKQGLIEQHPPNEDISFRDDLAGVRITIV